MRPFGTVVFPIVTIAVFLGGQPPSLAGMPDDLRLGAVLVQKRVVSPKPNPHDALPCGDCHDGNPLERPSPAIGPVRDISDRYPDALCLRCHTPGCELHVWDAEIGLPGTGVNPPDIFPVRSAAGGRRRMGCLTCHDVHYPHDGYKLLRGFSLNPRVIPSTFSRRLDFCRSCHRGGVERLSPHRRPGSGSLRCTFCHVKQPAEGGREPLKAGVNRLCAYCHQVYPEPHYLRYNPFPGQDEAALKTSGIPLPGGAYTCVTCHLPHGASGFTAYLRPAYIELARRSVRVNPHQISVFCLSCHPEKPAAPGTPGAGAVKLLEADIAQLCGRCHESGQVTGMYHPLAAIPPTMTVRDPLPLGEQVRVTCTTCHLAGHAPRRDDNPRFLRGGPYRNTQELCRKCHDIEGYASLNPHGDDKGCGTCHLAAAAHGGGSAGVGLTKADGNFVCLLCHDYMPHPAGFDHNVRPGEYDYVSLDAGHFPLDRYGRITCYTCHQVHQGTTATRFLRTFPPSDARMICSGCHPY